MLYGVENARYVSTLSFCKGFARYTQGSCSVSVAVWVRGEAAYQVTVATGSDYKHAVGGGGGGGRCLRAPPPTVASYRKRHWV